jgi:hypothetical protein
LPVKPEELRIREEMGLISLLSKEGNYGKKPY